eukprot:11366414-Ditylum_brightwellii.AAC.1
MKFHFAQFFEVHVIGLMSVMGMWRACILHHMVLYGGGGLAHYSGEWVICHLDILREQSALICMDVLQAGEASPSK